MKSVQKKERRYDLDYLRFILILMVFLHHSCMPYNGDKWLIMNRESSKILDDIMVFFEQWRLPFLFLISGAGTLFASSRRSAGSIFRERSKRLLIPLLFGILFIVPPQIYYSNTDRFRAYFDSYPEILLKMNSAHLWFLEYLYVFSLLALIFLVFLRSRESKRFLLLFERIAKYKYGMFLLFIPLSISNLLLREYFPEDSHHILNLSSSFYYLFFFIMGMIIASSDRLWEELEKQRHLNLKIFIASFIIFYSYYYIPGNYLSFISKENIWRLWYLSCHILAWSAIITALGFSKIYLNRASEGLKKVNEGIYPFYVIHQTVIVIFAYYIVETELALYIKVILTILFSFFFSSLIYRFLVYPFNIIRPFFGMKRK